MTMGRGKGREPTNATTRGSGESTSVESSSQASRDIQCWVSSAAARPTWKDNYSKQRDGESSFENIHSDDRRVVNEDVPTAEPDLEAYCNGSWWDARVLKKSQEQYYIHYEKFEDDQDEWVSLGHLRLRSRLATISDCEKLLDPGVDVCLMTRHPHSDDPHPAWFDAKIIDVERKAHSPRSCKCLFHVRLFTIPKNLPSDYTLRRLLPMSSQPMQLSNISIMRIAYNLSFQQVVTSALPNMNRKLKRRWALDGTVWYSSFLDPANKVRNHSFSLESMPAGGCSVPTSFPDHTGGAPTVASELRPFDAFLEEEGLKYKLEEEDPKNGLKSSSPQRRSQGDAVPVEMLRSPVWIARDDVKIDNGIAGSKTQPIVLDLDNDTESTGISDKVYTSVPDIRSLDRFATDEQATSPESLDGDVGEAPMPAMSSGDELDRLILRELNVSSQTSTKSISSCSKGSISLTMDKPVIQKSDDRAASSESFDLDDYAGYLERNIGVESVASPWLDNSRKVRSTSNFPKSNHHPGANLERSSFSKKRTKETRSVTAYGKEGLTGMPLPKTRSTDDRDFDYLKMGLEDFADVLEDELLSKGPVVRDILARSKETHKVIKPKPKRQKIDEVTVGLKSVVKEVTYADLFQSVEMVHSKILVEEKCTDDGAGLLSSWNPLMECWGPGPEQEVQEDLKLGDVWEDMRVALESEEFVTAIKVDGGAEENRAETSFQKDYKCINVDGSKSEEDHVYEFIHNVGLVCESCGFVGLEIENMWERDNPKRIATLKEANDGDNRLDHGLNLWDSEDDDIPTRKNSPKGGSIFDPIPQLEKHMQKHQKEGFEFLWRNLAGVDPRGNPCVPPMQPGGCVLSHAPGTGKTFLIISFLQSYMKVNPKCRPLIVAPKIMLQPWEKEFRKWNVDIPVYNLNQASDVGRHLYQQHEEAGDVQLNCGSRLSTKQLRNFHRQVVLWEWTKTPSVLVISYAMFSSLTVQASSSEDLSSIRKVLQSRADILILDEGHFARNRNAQIRKQLMAVQTPLRIMLSGTLFQNNFEELFTSLNLVRSGFVEIFANFAGLNFNVQEHETYGDIIKDTGTPAEMGKKAKAVEAQARKLFIEEIGNKIDKGQRAQGSSESLAQGLEQLHKLTSPFVHHYTGGVLQNLPPLRDFAIMLQPTALQEKMVQKLTERLVDKTMLEQECILSLVCIHPTLFADSPTSKTLDALLPPEEMEQVITIRDPVVGVKTRFVINLLKLLQHGVLAGREKMLVFSQNLDPLVLLEEMLCKQFGWEQDKDFLQLDGKVQMNERQSIIERFNDPKGRVRVLLASTKACGEGITLTGASRVIFMDVLWNPAVIRQAIHRAFRLGQSKVVYVYRLIASGTFEESKYRKMVWKDWKSQAIFNSSVESPEQGKKTVSDACGPPQHSFWEISGDNSKDNLLKELIRQDNALGVPSFRRIFRHGGLFDDDYDSEPGGRGMDATDWLRGVEGADSFDLDMDISSGDGDSDDFDIPDDEEIVTHRPQDKADLMKLI